MNISVCNNIHFFYDIINIGDRVNEVIKAGCILIDRNNKQVALVYRKDNDDYSFPKGHLEKNESIVECAIRETEEETKRIPIVDSKFDTFKTEYNNKEGKVTVYYFIAYDGGKSDNKSNETHPLIWLNYDDVYDRLTYETDKELWNKIKVILK